MNPIHAITDRLGNKGTLALFAVIIVGIFAALDYRTITGPSPKLTMLEDAWQAYDRAALSRDAPEKPFDSTYKPFTLALDRISTLTHRGPNINQEAERTFEIGYDNLRECQSWLLTYRKFVPVLDPNIPDATRDNARDHIDACTDAHPVNPRPPSRGINDD